MALKFALSSLVSWGVIILINFLLTLASIWEAGSLLLKKIPPLSRQHRNLDVLITYLYGKFLRKCLTPFYAKMDFMLANTNTKPDCGNSLKNLLFYIIAVYFYPHGDSKHDRLLESDKYGIPLGKKRQRQSVWCSLSTCCYQFVATHTQTHTDTQRHRDTDTHTHTHAPHTQNSLSFQQSHTPVASCALGLTQTRSHIYAHQNETMKVDANCK